LDNILAYIVLTAALSSLQVWDNYRLIFAGENPVSIDWSFSFIEFSWVFVSIAVIYYGTLGRYEILVPVAFVLYNVYGWIVGYWYVKETDVLESKILYVPDLYLWFSLAYSCCLAIFSVFVFANGYSYRSEVPIQTFFLANKMTLLWVVVLALILIVIIHRFKKTAGNILNDQVKIAIQKNDQCSDYFGRILSVSENREVTMKLENDVFGFFVRGSRSRGFLVAKINTINSEEEFICSGYISTEDGSIIELEEQILEA